MSISCRVITPVGPGHEKAVENAIKSVEQAMRRPGRFTRIEHIVVDDTKGEMGRGAARNSAMGDDWHFFLDADDIMVSDAFQMNDFSSPATFGAVCLEGKIVKNNVYPCGWGEIAKHGPRGTLSMGFFYKGNLRFSDRIAGEDFEFYMKLPNFTKRACPLVSIGRNTPSAHGPKGYKNIDWYGICQKIIDATPQPYGFHSPENS